MLDPLPTTFDYHPPLEPYLSVVHVDDDILVLDKPSGLLVSPDRYDLTRPNLMK